MRAVVIQKPGGPEVLALCDVEQPEPPPEHVRVAVRFAGVNRADLLQRAGFYPAPPGVPRDIPGLEYAGVVDAVGSSTSSRFTVGERVFGLVAGGAYAEKVVVHEREVARMPAHLDDSKGAAIPEAFITAYDALIIRARLAPGERVLVHAAGSGVGTAAVQLAHAFGCHVVGTSRTKDKLDRCQSLGLTVGIATEDGKFADSVLKATDGQGVDVVLDLVGGSYVSESIRACSPRARMVLVGLVAGTSAEVDLGQVLRKRLEIIGTVLRSRPLEEKIQACHLLERHVTPWLTNGILQPVLDRIFPIADASAAHRYVATNASFGKVLLEIGNR